MDYDELLDRAYSLIPEKKISGERFEIPVADSFIEGNITILKNFNFLIDKLRRDPKHLLKYMTKELATPASLEGQRLVLQGKFPARVLNEKIGRYVKTYVLCKECGKPDTKMVVEEEHRRKILICEACGARAPVKE